MTSRQSGSSVQDIGTSLALVPDKVHRVLVREFAAFFRHMTTSEPGWPAIPNQSFVDALADALMTVGKEKGKDLSFIETLVIDLQDRLGGLQSGAVFWPAQSVR